MTLEQWRNAMLVASEPGEPIVPITLLQAVEREADPVSALMDWDLSSGFFSRLQEEFRFFARLLPTDGPLPPEDLAQGIAVLRWLIEQFRGWRAASDPKLTLLTTLVVVVQSCAWDSNGWFQLDEKLLGNAQLSEKLASLLSNAKTDFQIRTIASGASEEGFVLDQLREAERKADWTTLLPSLRRMNLFVRANPLIVLAVQYLYRHDLAALVRAARDIDRAGVAQSVAESLSVEQRFQLAIDSGNSWLQLLSLETALHGRTRRSSFSGEEEQKLSALLQRMAENGQVWFSLLSIYNARPAAYPALQKPLGTALRAIPEAGLEAYVRSLSLSVPCDMSNRQQASACLETFRSGANADHRRFLWAIAFQRWSEWNFGSAAGEYVGKPTLSELDFAVVGHLKEGLTPGECIEEQRRIESELPLIECKWFRTVSDLKTAWNRLISRIQPYAHAMRRGSESGWLAESPNYRPTGSDNLYVSLRVG
jgi:hypothetical protein